jgi:serine/threonine protein kinase
MGEVWLAYDEDLDGRPVAIKKMHPHMLADAEDVARFQREMRIASRMQHPNIMTMFTTGSDNGVPFMVMEYLEGSDLGEAPPGWPADYAARIGREACLAPDQSDQCGNKASPTKAGSSPTALIRSSADARATG